jgi:uncharacterized protein YecE (DUF72 family)
VGRQKGEFRVGTSGYQYRHWGGDFYPADVPARAWFACYTERFDTVEINNTFYHLPNPEAFDRWRQEAPPGFCFALKYSRYATHLKHLKEPVAALEPFLERARRLGSALGPILVQLPPHWQADPDRLDHFLRVAARRHRLAVELRDPSWLCNEVFAVLRQHGAALVLHDKIEDHPIQLTADWTYLRFHGREYGGSYSAPALAAQARRIRGWLDAGHDVYAYFNNDVGGHAPRNAADLRRYVEGGPQRARRTGNLLPSGFTASRGAARSRRRTSGSVPSASG